MQCSWYEAERIRRGGDRRRSRSTCAGRHRVVPQLEPIEDRTLLSLSIGTNFSGADLAQSEGFIPPDTQGAAGPTQLVETINNSFTVFSKTGTLVEQTSLDSFFNTALAAGGGGTVTSYSYDPRIIYDPQGQRYFVAGDDNPDGVNSFIIAVSSSSDATAGWKAWKVNSDPTGQWWMDFPTLGVTADGVYLAGDMFPIPGKGQTSDLTDILVIPKSDLTSGVGVTNATLFSDLDPNNTGFAPEPITDLNSGQGLAQQPEIFLSDYNTPAGYAKLTEITGTVTNPVLNTNPALGDLGGGFLTVPARGEPPLAPQLGTNGTIDTDDTRFSGHVIEQGSYIWAVQAVQDPTTGNSDIAWYRISVSTGAVVEQGTIASSSMYYYYPSIAVNANGDVVIGFSGSSSSTYVGSYAVTGTFNGTTTTLGSPQLLQAGTGPYYLTNGGSANRWGDYSAVVLDPNDQDTFWVVQEWASTVGTNIDNSAWSTQFTAFGDTQTVTGVSSTNANGTYSAGAQISVTVGFSDAVVVTGTPELALNSGGTATYTSGSGTNTLTFTYTVGAGQSANPLDEASTSALTLNGGTINDINSGVHVSLTLPAPGTTGSLGENKTIIISSASTTTVTGVSSTNAAGSYGVSSTIVIDVNFSNIVNVTGSPVLALNTGGTATYAVGSGTKTLGFTYIVAAGQDADPLDDASTSALTLNGGTIDDQSSNPAVLTLPSPGSSNSLSQSKIVVDTTAPTVTAVSSTTANGSYGVGSVIDVTVAWSKPVVVTGTPKLALNSGGTASYSSGSGTSTLTFVYTVAAGQDANPLDEASASALTLNGGTIFDTVGTNPNAAVLTLPAPGTTGSLGKNKTIVVNTTAPTVTAVSSTNAAGSYGVGSVIDITIAWSEPVVVTGTPKLALNSGGTASYSSGSGTSALTFVYTVAAGQDANPLDDASTSALTLNGGTIFDTVGTNPNAAVLTLPSPGSSNSLSQSKIVVDTTAPTVTAVSSTNASGSYGVGSVIDITVAWSEPVVVTGTPKLALNSGGTASYASGSGTSTLTFTYTVAAGQSANPLDEASASALTLSGGTIFDTVGTNPNAAVLTLPAPGTTGSLGKNKTIIIDTTSPSVTAVSSTTAAGSYGVGSVIDITIAWSKAVVVTGTPQLALNSGGTASYSSGSGTSTLTFVYTVAAGQDANPLDEASASALTLNGGTIFDTVTTNPNAAVLTLPAPGSSNSLSQSKIVVDTTAPAVTGVSSTNANGTYGIGSVIDITVSWSEPVVVTGTPELALNSGGTADYASGSGTSTLTFTYTVAAGQSANPLDEASASALTLNGGTIFDTVGSNPNAAVLTLPAPGTTGSLGKNKTIVVNTTAPTVTAVSSTNAAGSYGVGSVIDITVAWSKAVVVTGTPQLALNSGGTASYSSGSGTSTLTFVYTVAAGQDGNPLDDASTSALTLNGGTIDDQSSNPAVLTLPSPGSSNSLSQSKIVVDTTAPAITGVSSTNASGSYGVGSVIDITVAWSEPVVVTGTPKLALNSGGTASYASGSGTSTLTFTYTVAAGQDANPLDDASTSALTLNGGTIFDTVTTNPNAAVLTLPAPGSSNSLSQSKIVVDTTAPAVTGVSSTNANGTYGIGSVIDITVSWSEPVVVTGTPELALNSGGTADYASGSGTSTLTFTYTVAAGQSANPLDEASASALTLNGGTIFDTVGTNPNAAVLTLPAPGTTGSLGKNKTIIIDTTSPSVTAVSSTTAAGSYGVGSVIDITIAWSKAVVVTGTPQLALNSGGTADYSSGSGTSTLTFVYTVAAGQDANPLDDASTTALTLNGGTIDDQSGNAAVLTLPVPGSSNSLSQSKIVVNTTAPTVTSVASTSLAGAYGVGAVITVNVTWSQPVVVTGTPHLALNSGGTANYAGGSGTSTLNFTYLIAAGQNANPLDDASTSALTLNGGTIFDTVTNPNAADLTLPAPGSTNSLSQSKIVVDTTAPTVTAVTSTTPNGSYGAGSVIDITVSWSEPVVVTGTPELALNSGGTADYTSGSGTSTLVFTYTVAAGQNSSRLDYTSTTALTLNGGTIFDTVANPNAADLTLPAPGSSGSIAGTTSIAIDTTAPTVSSVSSTTPNGDYGLGSVITITVTWSKPVVVTGTPELALNSGGTADYTSGSGTSTLTFTYTVAAGQNANPLDEASASALTLNGGTIYDTVTNPNAANLTLPASGASGSLGVNKDIQIDTVAPTVLEYEVVFGVDNLTYNLIGSTRYDLPWQITGIEVVFSEPIATADVHSLTGLSTTGLSGLGTNTLIWSINTLTIGKFATSLLNSGLDAIKDAAGNSLAGAFDQNFNVLYGDFTDEGYVNSADLLAIYNAISQSYNIFADLNGDGVVNKTDVQIAQSRLGTHL